MEHIILEKRNGVGIIRLNRPDVLNSFNAKMAQEAIEAFDELGGDSKIRAILLTGEGRGFCAGQDLAEATAADAPPIEDIVERQYNPLILRIRSTAKPVVCAVNGVAAGAGANLAYACDLTLASENASFVQSFINIGLIPDSGGTYTLPRLVGMQRAFGQAILAGKVKAPEAESLGLIWKSLPADALMADAITLCERLATMPTVGIALTKEAFNRSLGSTLDQQLETEKELQAKAGASYDTKEGIQAFLEKRKPQFKGE
jgi:2-(1,2-epoxy-1,2-dihydrophenyl)acetyl-CoA isomerase